MKYFFWVSKVPLCCSFFLISMNVAAAQFTATLLDADGAPLADGVIALIPAQQPNYTDVPTALMDQRQNMFVPKVLAIRTNTQVRFPNGDDVRHHVYSFSPAKKFELRLYHGMTAEPVVFDKPGTVVLGCNIHDSMVAYIYVVDSEYFAVTDNTGKVSISAPAGSYQLQVYHPRLPGDYPASAVQLNESAAAQTIRLEKLNPPDNAAPADDYSNLF